MAVYSLEPVEVPRVNTKYRTIKTKIPVPQSLAIFKTLEKTEPRSMRGQPPIVWDRAESFTVYDRWGNRWIDWSSCVLVSNIGHGRKEIRKAIVQQAEKGLLATYVFVHEKRAELTRALQKLAPEPNNYRVFLLSTGSEAIENSLKLAKTYALEKSGPAKKYIISFNNAFHGRTMGAQLAGGLEKLKNWLVERDPCFVQVPFPDGYKNEDISFDLFLDTLEEKGVARADICAVITESYQGVGPDFMPLEYAQKLEEFCRKNDIVTIFDEIQAGFGRTGKMFTFQHYRIKPDLIVCGKGISSSLPLSAVMGRKDIMDLYKPGSMTSTHSASPICVASAIENLKVLKRDKLVENAARMGEILIPELKKIQQKYPSVLGCLQGKGLVAGIQVVKAGTKEPDPDTALEINVKSFQKGLLMFAPVGIAGECLKMAPPLTITEEPLRESIAVFEEAVDEVLGS
jgi:4-aminobutyrate aminotransferase-like enzyme